MPNRLPIPCRSPGCKSLTLKGFCEAHTPKPDYDTRPDKKFYHTPAWKRLRLLKLHSDPLCAHCGRAATLVDHINPIATGGQPSALTNLQSMCDECHNRKRAKEGRERRY